MAGEGGTPPAGEFSPEQIDKIQTITAGVLNSAMTARFKTFEKQLHESLGKTIGEQLQAHLKAAPPKEEAPDEEPEGGKGKKGKNAARVDDVQINTLQQQLAEMNRRLEAADRAANEERMKNRTSSLRTKLAEELARIGVVDANAQRIAIGHLIDAKHAVKFDDEGGDENKIVFSQDDGGVVNLDVGLRTWAKTSEAKFFLPATNAKGAGSRPGGSPLPGHAPVLDRSEQERRVWDAVTDELSR
jgi:hypothetical protein